MPLHYSTFIGHSSVFQRHFMSETCLHDLQSPLLFQCISNLLTHSFIVFDFPFLAKLVANSCYNADKFSSLRRTYVVDRTLNKAISPTFLSSLSPSFSVPSPSNPSFHNLYSLYSSSSSSQTFRDSSLLSLTEVRNEIQHGAQTLLTKRLVPLCLSSIVSV